MKSVRYPKIALLSLLVLWTLATGATAAERPAQSVFDPVGLLLSWQRDPTTTMTIDWHVTPDDAPRLPGIEYRRAGTDEPWKLVPGSAHPFPLTNRTIYRTELTGLNPATRYQFRFGENTTSYLFSTMPAHLARPVRFVVGGDTGAGEAFEEIARVARAQNPDFIVIGGDFAYADGGLRDYADGMQVGESRQRWENWFDIAKRSFVQEDGRVIPVLAAIGNHEVWGGYHDRHPGYEQTDLWRQRIAQVYYQVFPFTGQPGYAALDFSDYLSLVLLDTDHSNPIDGQQKEWLKQTLAARNDGRHLFPVYHVTAYPSLRAYDDKTQSRVREHWVPLFEAHNVKVAFEHHDHLYKRTEPIRNGKVDPSGVVYLGDGSFGLVRSNREVHKPEDTWYLHKSVQQRHFILVQLDKEGASFSAINEKGENLDHYALPATTKE